MTVNHEPPADTQAELSVYWTSADLIAQAALRARDTLPTSSQEAHARQISTAAAQGIAAQWQSPGPDGIGMAQFASTGTITDDLLAEIDHEVQRIGTSLALTGGGDPYDDQRDSLTELRALRDYVHACTIPVWVVGSNIAGYLPEGDVTPYLDYADAVNEHREMVKETPEEWCPDGCECDNAEDVPEDFPVRVLRPSDPATDRATCGGCGRSWDDAIATGWTPAPSGRCPFEYFHASSELCEACSLEAQVGAYIAEEIDPAPLGERDLLVYLRPDYLPFPTAFWVTRDNRTVAEYISEREGY